MPQKSKRYLLIRRVFVYIFMTFSVITLSTILTFFMLGYRFNQNEGVFLQGGLVQFISQPSGAKVTVGSARLANKTRSKITLNPGNYLVTMELPGYQTWQKSIHVEAGKVLWLNSALFVPTTPSTTLVNKYTTVTSSSMQVGGKYYAVMTDSKKPNIMLTDVSAEQAKTTTVTIPDSAFTPSKNSRFSLESSGYNDTYFLVKHSYDKSVEWIAVNVDSPGDSRRIAVLPTSNVKTVAFDPRSNSNVFVQYDDGTVRGYSLSSGTMVDPTLTNIASFSVADDGTLFYVTKPLAGKVSTGYLTHGKAIGQIIDAYTTSEPVNVVGQTYYNSYYLATSVGKSVTVTEYASQPSSDVTTLTEGQTVTIIDAKSPVRYLSLNSNGRLVTIQTDKSQDVYDIELGTLARVPIAGVKTKLTQPLPWLDNYHFWSDSDTTMRQYEFDGTNQTSIVPSIASGSAAGYARNGEYLYTIGKATTGYQLQRTKMIIN